MTNLVQDPDALRQVLQDTVSNVIADEMSKPAQEQGETGLLAWDSVEVGQQVVFQPHNSKTQLKGTVKEIDEKKVRLQCGRVRISVTQDKGVLKVPPQREITAKSNDKSMGIDL